MGIRKRLERLEAIVSERNTDGFYKDAIIVSEGGIVTQGSHHLAKFVGRPVEEVREPFGTHLILEYTRPANVPGESSQLGCPNLEKSSQVGCSIATQ